MSNLRQHAIIGTQWKQRNGGDSLANEDEVYNELVFTDKVAKEMFKAMDEREKSSGELNPILVMSDSGARGSAQQIRRLSWCSVAATGTGAGTSRPRSASSHRARRIPRCDRD